MILYQLQLVSILNEIKSSMSWFVACWLQRLKQKNAKWGNEK
jgi:hypothetical protein